MLRPSGTRPPGLQPLAAWLCVHGHGQLLPSRGTHTGSDWARSTKTIAASSMSGQCHLCTLQAEAAKRLSGGGASSGVPHSCRQELLVLLLQPRGLCLQGTGSTRASAALTDIRVAPGV